jgi:hypothetical protein
MYVKKLNPKYVHLSLIELILNRCFPQPAAATTTSSKAATTNKTQKQKSTQPPQTRNDEIEAEGEEEGLRCNDDRGPAAIWCVPEDGQHHKKQSRN